MKLLMMKNLMYLTMALIVICTLEAFEISVQARSDAFVNDDQSALKNRDLALTVQPYAKLAHISHLTVRLVLILISMKKPHVTKLAIYYEALLPYIMLWMPTDLDLSTAMLI